MPSPAIGASPAIPSSSTVTVAAAWDRLIAVADAIAPHFDDTTRSIGEWVDSGLLVSDGLCFCALCEWLDVDAIIEAGTGFGGSTEMFARYFAGGDRPMQILSIDRAATPLERVLSAVGFSHATKHLWPASRQAAAVAAERLRDFENVQLLHGDALELTPKLVAHACRNGRAVGVLIDGPKEGEQMQLAESLLESFSEVRFVAVDDIGPKYDHDGRYRRFRRSRYAAFATSDQPYFARYGWINRGRVPSFMTRDPQHTGYGMGVLLRHA